MSTRVLGLDYGMRRIGVALSDGLGLTAQPLETVVNKADQVMERLQAIIASRQVSKIVIGLPKHLNNQEGVKADEARAFGARLQQATGLPIEFIDERLSTVAAARILMESNLSGQKKRQVIDKLAAAIILQTWLDSQKNK
jgi:putative Holliday junction resolvase